MGFDSAKQPELEERGHQPIGGSDAPDPWGVRRAENLLTSLEGVLSARVVTTPLGEVSEVHVLAQAGLSPKQVVRNVESALLAQLGLKVDHRKISIAQTADVKPIEALEKDTVREQVLQGWIDENRRTISEEYYAELLARYDVIIEGQADGESPDIGALPGS